MTPLCKSPLRTMRTLRLPPASRSTIRTSPLCKLLLRTVRTPRLPPVSKKTISATPVQILAVDEAPPSASFHQYNQYDSSVQIPAAGDV
jgi:hypothetical protein